MYLARLSILEKLEIHVETICDTRPDLGDHVEEDPDGMTTADGVAVLLEVVGEASRVHPLND